MDYSENPGPDQNRPGTSRVQTEDLDSRLRCLREEVALVTDLFGSRVAKEFLALRSKLRYQQALDLALASRSSVKRENVLTRGWNLRLSKQGRDEFHKAHREGTWCSEHEQMICFCQHFREWLVEMYSNEN